MSRSGYIDDCDDVLAEGRWRAAVNSAFRGRRGQAFLKEALAALDAMPDKRLIREQLEIDGWQHAYGDADYIVGGDVLVDAHSGTPAPMGEVCLLGAVGRRRGLDLSKLDPDDIETVAHVFGIAEAMAREVVWWNDDGGPYRETPEARWQRMRNWVAGAIKKDAAE